MLTDICNEQSEMLSLLWSLNLFIQVWKLIFIKLSYLDLISINLTLSPVLCISIITSIIFSSPGKIPINSINSPEHVAGKEFTRLQWVSLAFCNLDTNGQIQYARKTKRHDIIFLIVDLFPLLVKYTAIIRWPPRKVTALQVVKTLFLDLRPHLFSPPAPS